MIGQKRKSQVFLTFYFHCEKNNTKGLFELQEVQKYPKFIFGRKYPHRMWELKSKWDFSVI